MNNLQKEDLELHNTVEKQHKTIGEKRVKFQEKIQFARNELKELNEECDLLHKSIFSLGDRLKRKVSSKEFEALKEVVDNWNLEGFMHHRELEKTWQKYADNK
ncbi:MAG: hypothetical protein ACLFSN_04350 [Candidatus Woesearchaeota archaeon]